MQEMWEGSGFRFLKSIVDPREQCSEAHCGFSISWAGPEARRGQSCLPRKFKTLWQTSPLSISLFLVLVTASFIIYRPMGQYSVSKNCKNLYLPLVRNNKMHCLRISEVAAFYSVVTTTERLPRGCQSHPELGQLCRPACVAPPTPVLPPLSNGTPSESLQQGLGCLELQVFKPLLWRWVDMSVSCESAVKFRK